MVDFFISSLNLRFEMDQLPQIVTVHVPGSGGLHLHLRHRDQDLAGEHCKSSDRIVFNVFICG